MASLYHSEIVSLLRSVITWGSQTVSMEPNKRQSPAGWNAKIKWITNAWEQCFNEQRKSLKQCKDYRNRSEKCIRGGESEVEAVRVRWRRREWGGGGESEVEVVRVRWRRWEWGGGGESEVEVVRMWECESLRVKWGTEERKSVHRGQPAASLTLTEGENVGMWESEGEVGTEERKSVHGGRHPRL